MSRLSSNLAKLPEYCYSVTRLDNKLIKIKRGEEGYYTAFTDNQDVEAALVKFGGPENLCTFLNESINVTPAQREAMENGSMFGWDIAGADPDQCAKYFGLKN